MNTLFRGSSLGFRNAQAKYLPFSLTNIKLSTQPCVEDESMEMKARYLNGFQIVERYISPHGYIIVMKMNRINSIDLKTMLNI